MILKQNGVKISLSKDHSTGNFWIDTGLVVLLRQFGEGEHKVDDILQWLKARLLRPSGNKGEYYNQQTGKIYQYDKINWVYPTTSLLRFLALRPKSRLMARTISFVLPSSSSP
jgi:hypothetical protein